MSWSLKYGGITGFEQVSVDEKHHIQDLSSE